MQKDEMEQVIKKVLTDAERREKSMDAEMLIGEVKSVISKHVGELLASRALLNTLLASQEDREQVAHKSLRMKHTAFLIAEAAEIIMRRTWID